MKNCPFCSEEIQDSAKKCRYCGERLNDKSITNNVIEVNKSIEEEKVKSSKKANNPFKRQNIGMIIGGIAIFSGLGAIGNGDNNGIDTAMFGFLLFIFSWCYKSAKKRSMEVYKKNNLIFSLEILLILISFFVVFGQNNLEQNITNNPLPLLVLIAGVVSYVYINFKMTKKKLN